jgi:hypothetical protein
LKFPPGGFKRQILLVVDKWFSLLWKWNLVILSRHQSITITWLTSTFSRNGN